MTQKLFNNKEYQKSKILVNSVPKSGTHLLSRVIELIGYCNISSNRGLIKKIGDHSGIGIPTDLSYQWIRRNWKRRIYTRINKSRDRVDVSVGGIFAIQVPAHLLIQWLRKVPSGHSIIGHIPYSPKTNEILKQLQFKNLVIIRDPRDILISFIHYAQIKGGVLRADMRRLSKDEQILLAFEGGFAPISGINVTGIKKAFSAIMDWKQSSNFLLVRFEELVGEKGGGSHDKQHKAVKEICNYLELNIDKKSIARICAAAFDDHAPTFRIGQVGSWKNELTLQQSNSFSQKYHRLLDELDYA